METRSPTKYLIDKFKEAGADVIVPNGSVRFVKEHLHALPDDWQGLSREGIMKRIREACEQGAATCLLKRKRIKNISGYVYEINDDGIGE